MFYLFKFLVMDHHHVAGVASKVPPNSRELEHVHVPKRYSIRCVASVFHTASADRSLWAVVMLEFPAAEGP